MKSAENDVGEFIPKLPSYNLEEVGKHDSADKRIWVTYRQGVYDITDFVVKHPGGDKILMAAGGSVEPFWLMYGVHKTPEILAILEAHRIGKQDRHRFLSLRSFKQLFLSQCFFV